MAEECGITGGQLVASPFGTIRRPQGRTRRPLGRHIPCAQKIAADLREEGFSPESTAPMTMTVLSIKKRTTPSRPCARGPADTVAVPGDTHPHRPCFSPRTHPV